MRATSFVLASAPLVLSTAASAEFLGLTWVKKDITGLEDQVALVVNIYAEFDSNDFSNLIVAVAGIPGSPLNINVRDGVFYQHPAGGNLAPNQMLIDGIPAVIPPMPSLALDTFVTIGEKSFTGNVVTGLSPAFPDFGPNRLIVEDGAWFATPDDLNTHVGQVDNPPNMVLLGQFSIAAGAGANAGVFGTMFVQGTSNGVAFQEYLSFDNQLPGPGALALLGIAGVLGTRRRRR